MDFLTINGMWWNLRSDKYEWTNNEWIGVSQIEQSEIMVSYKFSLSLQHIYIISLLDSGL